MVIPLALGAQDGQLEIGVQCLHRDVKAVDFLGGSVGVGHGVGGGLEPVGLMVRGIRRHTDIEVDDLLGLQADVQGHLAVFHGQRALAVAGLIDMEHAAVGIKLRRIGAVFQRPCRRSSGTLGSGLGDSGFRHGRHRLRGSGRSHAGSRAAAASQRSSQQGGHCQQRNKTRIFHCFTPQKQDYWNSIARNWGNRKGGHKQNCPKRSPFPGNAGLF